MRLRLRHLLLALSFLSLPSLALAESATVLKLGDRTEQVEWSVKKIDRAETLSTGVRIRTAQTGFLTRNLSVPHSIDVVEILYTSPGGAQPSLMWRKQGSQPNEYYQLPIELSPASTPTPITIELSSVGNWTTHPISLGLMLPAGTDVTLHGIKLEGWSLSEKLSTAFQCFWKFDSFKAYSINFLWGPLLCTTPVSLENLYRHQPPIAHSALRIIYFVLILGAGIFAVLAWFSRRRLGSGTALKRTLLLTLVLWMFLDIRMGAEFFGSWSYDVRSFLREPVGQRVFRNLNFFPDFATAVKGLLADQPRFVLLTPTANTFRNYMRYQTWPSEPVAPENGSGAAIWLVYERPDITVNGEGRLVENGLPLSPPGTVIHEFMKGTFAFRLNPSPSAPLPLRALQTSPVKKL